MGSGAAQRRVSRDNRGAGGVGAAQRRLNRDNREAWGVGQHRGG